MLAVFPHIAVIDLLVHTALSVGFDCDGMELCMVIIIPIIMNIDHWLGCG